MQLPLHGCHAALPPCCRYDLLQVQLAEARERLAELRAQHELLSARAEELEGRCEDLQVV